MVVLTEMALDLDTTEVKKAVSALKELASKKGDNVLLNETDSVYIQLTFKLIPKVNNKIIKIPLSHPISTETTDVCLFVKDINKKTREYGPTVRHYQELLESKGIKCVSEIIPLKQLKLEYQPYEAKRGLSNKFDIFLTDERILRLLPGFLGKSFYGRKRHPVQVNLNAADLKQEIERAVNNSRCIISGKGSNSMAKVGHSDMTLDELTENVVAAARTLAQAIPGGVDNIRSLHLKTEDSPALPIFVSLGSAEGVTLPVPPPKPEEDEPEEIDTLMEGKVRVTRLGYIQVFKEGSDGARKDDTKRKRYKRKAVTVDQDEVVTPTEKSRKKSENIEINPDVPVMKDNSEKGPVADDASESAKKEHSPIKDKLKKKTELVKKGSAKKLKSPENVPGIKSKKQTVKKVTAVKSAVKRTTRASRSSR